MDLDLEGRCYVVTGGSSGLGLALAQRLLAEGAHLTLGGRDPGRLGRALDALGAPGATHAVAGDVRDPSACEALISGARRRWGRLDGLVNGAGHRTGGAFADLDDAAWQADVELKLLATVRLMRLALPALLESGGAVVNVLSIWSRVQGPRSLPSSALRAAGLAATNAVAAEHAGAGVRANAVLVGLVESGQWDDAAAADGLSPTDYTARLARELGVPAGRAGRGEEFADLAAFLLSPRASYVTGTAVNLDGGLSPVT